MKNAQWQFVVRTSDFYLSLVICHWTENPCLLPSPSLAEAASGEIQEQVLQARLGDVGVRNHDTLFARQPHGLSQEPFRLVRVHADTAVLRMNHDNSGQIAQ